MWCLICSTSQLWWGWILFCNIAAAVTWNEVILPLILYYSALISRKLNGFILFLTPFCGQTQTHRPWQKLHRIQNTYYFQIFMLILYCKARSIDPFNLNYNLAIPNLLLLFYPQLINDQTRGAAWFLLLYWFFLLVPDAWELRDGDDRTYTVRMFCW